jgi:hypothetical protein
VYAADRVVLKDIIMRPQENPEHQVISRHVNAEQQVSNTLDSADVADAVMDDLERLSKLKHTFENLFMEYPKAGRLSVRDEEKKEIKNRAGENALQEIRKEPSAAAVSAAKSKKERIIEMARAMGNGSAGEVPPKKKRVDKDGHPLDELIEEIQSSKDEIIPESEKQKQQIEIINQFIRVQPSISSPKDRIPSAGDLTPIKSGEFGDNIVSETLVEILVKQGKKDKAIEVLKKLIWKYPQKKAYFASQIEDLKK